MKPQFNRQTSLSFLFAGLILLVPFTEFHPSGSTSLVASAGPFDSLFRNCCYYVTIRNCSGTNEVSHRCADCSKPTPYCGRGKCNIFGCNCDGCLGQKNGTQVIGSATWITENF
ncbi:hypothetical protein TYRP_016518 [Tyrophagus putrescentiae]|nr:hypothetical protein TYRP_016518 [Tyrophagus putrescentiae]